MLQEAQETSSPAPESNTTLLGNSAFPTSLCQSAEFSPSSLQTEKDSVTERQRSSLSPEDKDDLVWEGGEVLYPSPEGSSEETGPIERVAEQEEQTKASSGDQQKPACLSPCLTPLSSTETPRQDAHLQASREWEKEYGLAPCFPQRDWRSSALLVNPQELRLSTVATEMGLVLKTCELEQFLAPCVSYDNYLSFLKFLGWEVVSQFPENFRHPHNHFLLREIPGENNPALASPRDSVRRNRTGLVAWLQYFLRLYYEEKINRLIDHAEGLEKILCCSPSPEEAKVLEETLDQLTKVSFQYKRQFRKIPYLRWLPSHQIDILLKGAFFAESSEDFSSETDRPPVSAVRADWLERALEQLRDKTWERFDIRSEEIVAIKREIWATYQETNFYQQLDWGLWQLVLRFLREAGPVKFPVLRTENSLEN